MVSYANNEVKALSHDLLSILDACGVTLRFRDFCAKNGVLTPTDLGVVTGDAKDLKADLLDAMEIDDLSFVEKKDIKKAWFMARGQMGAASSSSAAPAAATVKKMPDGAENRLRGVFKTTHGMNLPGAWMTTENVMTQMYLGLQASSKTLFVPDVSSILRKSLLQQKSSQGTLITDHGIEHLDYTMSPCTTHPEFFLRIRSYIATIAFIMIDTPEFFSFETAIGLIDYIFEAINCRPDGRRPGLVQLTSCYMAMFGDYAKALQNEGVTLEAWLAFKGNWQHIWRDASAAEVDENGQKSGSNLVIPDDLRTMMATNSQLMKGMQSNFDKRLNSLQNEVNNPTKKWGKGGNKQQKRTYCSQGGPGGKTAGNGIDVTASTTFREVQKGGNDRGKGGKNGKRGGKKGTR